VRVLMHPFPGAFHLLSVVKVNNSPTVHGASSLGQALVLVGWTQGCGQTHPAQRHHTTHHNTTSLHVAARGTKGIVLCCAVLFCVLATHVA